MAYTHAWKERAKIVRDEIIISKYTWGGEFGEFKDAVMHKFESLRTDRFWHTTSNLVDGIGYLRFLEGSSRILEFQTLPRDAILIRSNLVEYGDGRIDEHFLDVEHEANGGQNGNL